MGLERANHCGLLQSRLHQLSLNVPTPWRGRGPEHTTQLRSSQIIIVILLSIIALIIFLRLTVEAAHCFRLITFSWAPEVDVCVDYFLVLTDSACFHICPGFISGLSDVVYIKHIQESPQIFGVCVRRRSTGAGALPFFLWKDSLSMRRRLAPTKVQSHQSAEGPMACHGVSLVRMTLLRCE